MKIVVKCSSCKKVLFEDDDCVEIDTSKIEKCNNCESKKIDVDIS